MFNTITQLSLQSGAKACVLLLCRKLQEKNSELLNTMDKESHDMQDEFYEANFLRGAFALIQSQFNAINR